MILHNMFLTYRCPIDLKLHLTKATFYLSFQKISGTDTKRHLMSPFQRLSKKIPTLKMTADIFVIKMPTLTSGRSFLDVLY